MAQIAAPLNKLLKKETPWYWDEEQQLAFDKLKRRCASTPVLAIPSQDAELVLRCDASKEAMGVALYHRDNKGFLQPIEFKSKAFNEAQERLAAHDREGLALLYALKSFRHFLLMRKFEVQTDNSALSQIFTSKDLSDLYARWYHKLAEFEGMTIKHRPGRKLYCADALSRRRQVEGDDARPFYVEKGALYKLKGGSQEQQSYRAAGNEEWHAQEWHAHTHTRAHAKTHARAHTCQEQQRYRAASEERWHARTHTRTHANIHARTHTRTHAQEQAQEHTQTKVSEKKDMPFNEHGNWKLELFEDAGHRFTVKVASTEEHGSAAIQDPQKICGMSGAFECQHLESASLQQWRQDWPALYKADPDLADIWISRGDDKWGYFEHKQLLWKMGPAGARLCLPQGADRVQVLQEMHDSKTAGHPGIRRTLAKVMGNFYWRGMYGDVVKYVETCHRCQISKIDRRARMGEPRALQVPEAPWDVVHMDWVTEFPKRPEGFNAILVFVCALTGMVHLQACKKTDTARDTANHCVKNLVRLHGMPGSIVSDRDVRLRADFWRALQQRLGTELRFTTAYTPNSNGKVERINAVLGDVLRSMGSFAGKEWVQNLDLAEFAINSSESSATGLTPFYANFSHEPRVPANLGKPNLDVPAAEELADAMLATITHTRDTLERAKSKYEKDNAGARRPAEVFKEGDKVLLSSKNLNLKVMARKLTSKFVGPFEIMRPPVEATNPNVVWLRVPRAFKIHMPINLKDVKRYHSRPDELGGPSEEIVEPIVVDGEERFEVEEILAERMHHRKRQVLVKWAGFDLLSATWEPIQNIPMMFIERFRGVLIDGAT